MEQSASGRNQTKTETIEETDSNGQAGASQTAPTLFLRLEQPRNNRHVVFHDGVIDNEHMNRKKSKCCCIYKKPLAFGESSSSDDEECEHCFGHPEKRRRNRKNHHHGDNHDQHGDAHDHNGGSCPLHRNADGPSTSTQAIQPTEVITQQTLASPITAGTPTVPDPTPLEGDAFDRSPEKTL